MDADSRDSSINDFATKKRRSSYKSTRSAEFLESVRLAKTRSRSNSVGGDVQHDLPRSRSNSLAHLPRSRSNSIAQITNWIGGCSSQDLCRSGFTGSIHSDDSFDLASPVLPRRIQICSGGAPNDSSRNVLPNNFFSTTKYELWALIPQNLWEQFHRVANVWFLVVSVFQMLPLDLSPTSAYATLIPLSCVLLVTFVKDVIEDIFRRRDDWRVNSRTCVVIDGTINNGHPQIMKWMNVTPGVFLYLERDEPIPADIVLLACGNEDGVAFVDTAQLDGETTLKSKAAIEETMRIAEPRGVLELVGYLYTDLPNKEMQEFHGMLFLQGFPRGVSVEAKNLLFRGSILRNTEWVYGLVAFTGSDTKLLRNLRKRPSKRSKVEATANLLLLIIFGVLLLAAGVSAVARDFYSASPEGSTRILWAWPEQDVLQDNKFLAIITFIIGYNNLIPISLYVTTDLARMFQARCMEMDLSMYNASTDSACKVRNCTLNDDLGQVEFVLTDKTGTLTENNMKFGACSIDGLIYGQWDESTGPVNHIVAMPPPEVCRPLNPSLTSCLGSANIPQATPVTSTSVGADNCPGLGKTTNGLTHSLSTPVQQFGETDQEIEKHLRIRAFWMCLSTCHSALVERRFSAPGSMAASKSLSMSSSMVSFDMGGNSLVSLLGTDPLIPSNLSPQEPECHNLDSEYEKLLEEAMTVVYRSSSPDDEALVTAARDYGFFFRRKVGRKVTINIQGDDEEYQILMVNDFTPERKRMSVVIQRVPNEENSSEDESGDLGESSGEEKSCELIASTFTKSSYPPVLYVKGAESTMLGLMTKSSTEKGTKTLNHLNDFTSRGYRTLVLGMRTLSEEEFREARHEMRQAKSALINRDAMVEAAAQKIESGLTLLGVTAVEDKIQQGVPETIDMLIRAGTKVWMLTGDHMDTAESVSIACKLIDQGMCKFKLDVPIALDKNLTGPRTLRKLQEYYLAARRGLNQETKHRSFRYCVLVNGSALATIMEEEDPLYRQLFLALACSSCSVVACRLAPAQKAAVVTLIKDNVLGNPIILAIGDGCNDVSMIHEANIGVGITGVEGCQAAQCADFAIGKFQFLAQLMFVHGRWNLKRICTVVCYSFYKNFLLVLPLAFYAPFNGFSGTTLYESYLLMTFNLAFTSVPILIVGVFDVDVCARLAMLVPGLYRFGVEKSHLNLGTLLEWVGRGVLHACIVSFIMHVVMSGWPAGPLMPDQLVMGSWAYFACVAIANVTLLLHTKAWMDWGVFLLIGSVFLFVVALYAYSDSNFILASTFEPRMVGVAKCLFGNLRSWLGLLLVTLTCAFSELALLLYKKQVCPNAADILEEVQKGHAAGLKKCSTDFSVEVQEGKLQLADFFRSIPAARPRTHSLRREGTLGVKPLLAPRRQSTLFQFPIRRESRESSLKSTSIVPVLDTDIEASFFVGPGSIVSYSNTRARTLFKVISDFVMFLRDLQWRKMTFVELTVDPGAGSVSDSKRISKHLNTLLSGLNDSQRNSSRRLSAASSSFSHGSPMAVTRSSSYGRGLSSLEETSATYARGSSGDLCADRTTSMVGDDASNDLIYSVVTLRFFSTRLELAFKSHLLRKTTKIYQVSAAFFVFLFGSWLLFEVCVRPDAVFDNVLIVTTCVIVGSVISLVVLYIVFHRSATEPVIMTAIITATICKHVYDTATHHPGLLFNGYFLVFAITGTPVRYTAVLLLVLYHSIASLVRYGLLTTELSIKQPIAIVAGHDYLPPEFYIFSLGATVLSLNYAYVVEKLMRRDFHVLDSLQTSTNQALAILKGMFPKEVVDHVMREVRGEKSMRKLQEDRGEVTVLFCDIFDFEGIIQCLRPMELVKLLDLVWMMFDRICEEHGTVKIETVGKTFMAAALPEEGSEASDAVVGAGATAVVLTAAGMLSFVSHHFTGFGNLAQFDVRIGCHTGRALSGVVGSTKPQFALFGDTVNTASRMQSTGRKGCVQVSGATYRHLQNDSRFTWIEKQIEVKGKGLMNTYLLSKTSVDALSVANYDLSSRRSSRRSSTSALAQLHSSQGQPGSASSSRRGSKNSDRGETPRQSQTCTETPRQSQTCTENDSSSSTYLTNGRADTRKPSANSYSVDPSEEPLDELDQGELDSRREMIKLFVSQNTNGLTRSTSDKRLSAKRLSAKRTSGKRLSGNLRRPSSLIADFVLEVASARSGSDLWRRLLHRGNAAGTCARASLLRSQWFTCVVFVACVSVQVICVTLHRGLRTTEAVVAAVIRITFVLVSIIVCGLLWREGDRTSWFTSNYSFVALALVDSTSCLAFFGYLCNLLADFLAPRLDNVTEQQRIFWTTFEGFFILVILLHSSRLSPQSMSPLIFATGVIMIDIFFVSITGVATIAESGLITEFCGCVLLLLLTQVVANGWDPRKSLEQTSLSEEHDRVSELLDSMLPKEVLFQMKSGQLSLAYSYKHMTLLFADIVGFTGFCAAHSAEQAVTLVTRLFAEFDRKVLSLAIYKVCTIGDAYVATNEPKREIADQYCDCLFVYEMAQYMLEIITNVRVEVDHAGLDMRIGMHCGKFVGGVIGTKRLRFDIWGEDVLIANDIESHGKAGNIVVSQSARDVLEAGGSNASFDFHAVFLTKMGNPVRTYICKQSLLLD